MKNHIILVIGTVFLFFAGCEFSPNNPWPSEYVGLDGEHFDATVNGAAWYPQPNIFFGGSPIDMSIDPFPYHGGFFTFTLVVRNNNNASSVLITVDSASLNGTYTLGDRGSSAWATYSSATTEFMTNSTNKGSITITSVDTTLRLVSGTFDFDATADDTIIQVQKGSFISSFD